MIRISNDDLQNLERKGSGTFGTIYKVDDNTAYKIYHVTVADDYSGRAIYNPTLSIPRVHYTELIKRSKKLKYTGGIKDIIYVDGQFGGVCIPYYDGVKLNTLMDEPLNVKIDLSRELIRNCKELTGHFIFPTDYKLNNILLSDGKIQLIDLDDKRTHVFFTPCVLIRSLSINALGETIQTFLKDFDRYPLKNKVTKELDRPKCFYSNKYYKIEKYLDEREKTRNFLFVDDDTEIDDIKEFVTMYGYNIVYLLNCRLSNTDEYLKIIQSYREKGLKIYDFCLKDRLDKYFEIENTNEAYGYSSNELRKIKSKN